MKREQRGVPFHSLFFRRRVGGRGVFVSGRCGWRSLKGKNEVKRIR